MTWIRSMVATGKSETGAHYAVEAHVEEPLPLGAVDRLVRVERELRASSKHHVYSAVTLVEERALWSARWRSVFTLLEERGAAIGQLTPELARAPEDSDLGILQRMLRGELPSRRAKEGPAVRGDGTLLLLRGDTTGDLAELTAALLVKHREGALVVRCKGAAALDTALARHGLPQQGATSASAWRPAMQLLPLALELAYAPRDPYRVLELLTLPVATYRARLEDGRAVQLAAYVRAIHVKDGKRSLPPAGYFALTSGRVITADDRMGQGTAKKLDGITLAEAWNRVEKTAHAVQKSLQAGHVHVAATKRALPLLEALGIGEAERASHYALDPARRDQACAYCDYPAICGTAWEAVR